MALEPLDDRLQGGAAQHTVGGRFKIGHQPFERAVLRHQYVDEIILRLRHPGGASLRSRVRSALAYPTRHRP